MASKTGGKNPEDKATKEGMTTVRLGSLKQPFTERARRICGNPSALLEQFARTVLAKDREEVWAFCFGWQEDKVQVKGEICAGDGIEVMPLIDEPEVTLPEGVRATPTRYALVVRGDSMDGIGGHSIVDGMYALFDKDKQPHNNCIAHVEWEDGGRRYCTVKKLMYREGSPEVVLKPTNPKYEPRTRKWEEIEVRGVLVTGWQPEE